MTSNSSNIYSDIEICQKDFENKFSEYCNDSCYDDEFKPAISKKFIFEYNQNYEEVFESNMLSKKMKTLVALAVASAINDPYCINMFYRDAIDFGWSEAEVKEVVEVATAVRSGFSSVHAVQKMNEAKEMVL